MRWWLAVAVLVGGCSVTEHYVDLSECDEVCHQAVAEAHYWERESLVAKTKLIRCRCQRSSVE